MTIALLLALQAEELLKKMEKAVSDAETVDVRFKAATEGKEEQQSEGRLVFDSTGKAFFEAKLTRGAKSGTLKIVSDGKRMVMARLDGKKTLDTPAGLSEQVRASLARSNIMAAWNYLVHPFVLGGSPSFDATTELAISEAVQGLDEKVGDREAKVVRYRLAEGKIKGHYDTTVWLDAKTGLPLKRVLVPQGKQAESGLTKVTEEFAEFKLGGKVDPATFQLPE